MKIAIGGFSFEANSFAPSVPLSAVPETIAGDEIERRHRHAPSTLGGFLDLADEDPTVDLVPLKYTRVSPRAPLSDAEMDDITAPLLSELRERGPWDGVLLSLHGNAMSGSQPNVDLEFLRSVREIVSARVPIGVTFDMHANLSESLAEIVDVVTVYQTTPHVDARAQGLKAARLLGRAVVGSMRPQTAILRMPLVIGVLNQSTQHEPLSSLLAFVRECEALPGVLSICVSLGSPYVDRLDLGVSITCTTNGNAPALAHTVLRSIGSRVWQMRAVLNERPVSADAAYEDALSSDFERTLLIDMGDNVFGGASGNSTYLLDVAEQERVRGVTLPVFDPAALRSLDGVAVGSRVSLELGSGPDSGYRRNVIRGTILKRFRSDQDGTGDMVKSIAPYLAWDAVVIHSESDNYLVVLGNRELVSNIDVLIKSGLIPDSSHMIVAKGDHRSQQAVEAAVHRTLWVMTPGETSPDLKALPYLCRPSPLYPFETDGWC